MRTSKLAVFHGSGRPLTVETVAVPELREGEILVRNEYATLCRSDLHTYSGKRVEKTPTILGHETVGVIVEMAKGAPAADARGAELRAGDRVTWAVYASDPQARLSRAGIPQKAPGYFKYGHEAITAESTLHGGLAEYCVLRRHTPVVRIDAGIPLPLLALINCAGATVAGAMRLAGTVRDRQVAIAGAGTLGVIACAMCKCAGARGILMLDIDEDRLERAKSFGADVAFNPNRHTSMWREILGPDNCGQETTVGLDFSGVAETMELLIGMLGVGGTAVFVGATYPQRALRIDAEQVVRRILTIRGLHNYNEQDLVAAVEFMESHHDCFPFESLVGGEFELDTVNEAFAQGMKSKAHRIGIRIA